MSADQIVWGDPPVPTSGNAKGVWVARLAPFRERAGQWGRLPGKHSTNTAHLIRTGRFSGIEKGDYEVRTANQTPKGKCEIYIRYVGNEATA